MLGLFQDLEQRKKCSKIDKNYASEKLKSIYSPIKHQNIDTQIEFKKPPQAIKPLDWGLKILVVKKKYFRTQ